MCSRLRRPGANKFAAGTSRRPPPRTVSRRFRPEEVIPRLDEGVRWAHLDIAGMAWANKASSTYDKGATGYGVRLLDQYVADVLEK